SKKVVTPAPVKAVKESCVTCGGAHSWYNCPATNNNQASVCATTGIPSEFTSYMKANESIVRNMQGLINEIRRTLTKQEENLRKNLNNDMRSILGSFFQNQASTSSTLPSNTIPNPKGSTAQIPPLVIPISIPEPDVSKTLPKTTPIPESDIPKNLPKLNIPYPS
ncbi:hypothetical protein Tco_1300296, partial [Tanacetum coccineum]